MPLVSPTIADLAAFSGRDSSSFGDYASEALTQATLLFYLATGLEAYPTDSQLLQLAKYGILDMADKIYLSQPYREATASPYQSETIGTYSYSKAVSAVKKGDATNVMWFDLAVSKLQSKDNAIGASGSIQGMEWDGLEVTDSGRARIIGASGNQSTSLGWSWDIDTNPDLPYQNL
jgi:hypothetical protein